MFLVHRQEYVDFCIFLKTRTFVYRILYLLSIELMFVVPSTISKQS